SRPLSVRVGALYARASAAVPDRRRARLALPSRRGAGATSPPPRATRYAAELAGVTSGTRSAAQPLLSVTNLTKHFPIGGGLFGRKEGAVRAVDGVSFDVAPGETFGLVVESGCGKSTTGRVILRLLEPTSGSVRFDGEDVFALDAARLRGLRRKMQIIFQDPFSSLNPRMTIGAIVREGLTIHRI